MAKVDRITEILGSRITQGAYAVTVFPSEIRLAEEIGVSRMTARRAILNLLDRGLLERELSGRTVIAPKQLKDRALQIGFLTPSVTALAERWHHSIELAVQPSGGHVQMLTYRSWEDPILWESMRGFDGLFVAPRHETLTDALAAKVRQTGASVVMLSDNYSAQGLHSLDLLPPSSIQGLLDHLAALGHRQISLFNTQPMNTRIEGRVEQWQLWLAAQNLAGELINEPEPDHGNPLQRASIVANERLNSGIGFGGTAVLCTTMPATMGLMRALHDRGIVIGRDISVCCANGEGIAHALIPTVTCLEWADPMPFLKSCIDWMSGGEWIGPLLKSPAKLNVFEGESTGSASSQLLDEHQHPKTQEQALLTGYGIGQPPPPMPTPKNDSYAKTMA